jgi:hypothetical protein
MQYTCSALRFKGSIQWRIDSLDNNKSLWNILVDDKYDDDGDNNDNGSDNDDTLI